MPYFVCKRRRNDNLFFHVMDMRESFQDYSLIPDFEVSSIKMVQPFKLHSVCERFAGAVMWIKSIKIKFM